MKTKHFEIFEEKHLPPDWEAMEDQLARWIYDPEVLKMILKKRDEEAWTLLEDDPEVVLLWYLEGVKFFSSKPSGRLHYQSYTKAGRLGRKLLGIGVNYDDVDGGYSLIPLSTYDPLRLFYPVMTDKDYSKVALNLELGNLADVYLSFLSDEGLVSVVKVSVMDRVHLMEPSWAKWSDRTDFFAYKNCIAAWVVAASKKTGLRPTAFVDVFGKPIPIDHWISQELEGLK